MSTALTSPTSIPRPPMPYGDADANLRAQRQSDRYAVLTEQHEELARAWIEQHVEPDFAGVLGIPDLSVNTLATNSQQSSALYDSPAMVQHPESRADVLIGPNGYLADYWVGQQWCQYLAVGIGDWIRVPEVVDGRLVGRHVSPANVYVVTDPRDPRRAIELWELRTRSVPREDGEGTETAYVWDRWMLADPDRAGEPSYRILVPASAGGYRDVTAAVEGREFWGPIAPASATSRGSGYPWRLGGVPFIPHVFYSPVDDGQLLHPTYRRGVYHGTLNAIMHWTAVKRALLSTSGEMVLTFGLKLPEGKVQDGGKKETRRTLQVTPNAVVQCAHDEQSGANAPNVWKIGPGQNLEVIVRTASEYEAQQRKRWGAGESSATRTGASPWSGAALTISNHDRREAQRRMEPCFRRADLEYITKAVGALKAAGKLDGDFPESGYSITYASIPLTPDEQKQEREQLDWEEASGLLSPTQKYMRLHPGSSVEAAERAIVQAAIEQARTKHEIDLALAAAGLAEQPGGAGAAGEELQTLALNGAQVTSLLEILGQVSSGTLTRDGAVAVIAQAFPMITVQAAEQIVDGVKPAPADAKPSGQR